MKRESKAERKHRLMSRLMEMGFTYEEAHNLCRIEMTLSKWAEHECNGEIERDETTGKPERVSRAYVEGLTEKRHAWRIADREAGALKRLKAIVDTRNGREYAGPMAAMAHTFPDFVHAYHQSDPRGCALYLVKASDLPETTDEAMRKHSGEWPLKSEETRLQWKLSVYYARGLAVCA